MRAILHTLRVVATILLLSVLLLEAVLQVAARWVVDQRGAGASLPAVMTGKTTRIVTMGDSNTYGLYLSAEESYPLVLQQEWNRLYPANPIEVINLGFPGTNSSRVLKSLPDVISTFGPDIITVMVGVNDFWTAPVDVEGVSSPVSAAEGWLRDHSRTYKLVFMLWREFSYDKAALQVDDEYRNVQYDAGGEERFKAALEGAGQPITQDKPQAVHYGDKPFDIGYVFSGRNDKPAAAMFDNMARMVAIANSSGVKLVFITYAYFEQPQKTANQQMKLIAKKYRVPLINVARPFRDACVQGEAQCHALFFPDYHPTAAGYRLLAHHIAQALPDVLQDQVSVPDDHE